MLYKILVTVQLSFGAEAVNILSDLLYEVSPIFTHKIDSFGSTVKSNSCCVLSPFMKQ